MNVIKTEPEFFEMLPSDNFIKFPHDEALNENLPTLIKMKKEILDPDDKFYNLINPLTLVNHQIENTINIKTEPPLLHNNNGLSKETLSSTMSDAKDSLEFNLNQSSTPIIKHESIDIKVESHDKSDVTPLIPDLESSLISIKDENYGKLENFTQNECLAQSDNNFCNICGKDFVNVHIFNRHCKEIHIKSREYLCKICNKTFFRKEHLKKHEKIVHLKIADWKCSFCDKFFTQKGHLKVHENSVHLKIADWKCSFCDKFFTRKGHLKVHENSVHLKVRDWKCNFCDNYFAYKANLIVHEKSVHLTTRDWKCNVCDVYFTIKNNLIRHENSVHLNIRRWKCNICEKSFVRKDHLKSHRRVHISDFSEVCDICNKAVRHLRSHKYRVHSETCAKNFKCTHCDKVFLRKHNLNQHMILHSDVRD